MDDLLMLEALAGPGSALWSTSRLRDHMPDLTTLRRRLRLAGRAVRHPERALLRLVLQARLARLDGGADHQRFLGWLSQTYGANAQALEAEYHGSSFRRDFRKRLSELRAINGPRRLGTSDAWALKALYLLVRAARPSVIVETGVLYGASSAHILAALEANGAGTLYSIDLPHAPTEPPAGFLVPPQLLGRWTLIEGDSRRELPRLLERLRTVDCFHHDSLHTFEHMVWEFETALPYLNQRGILASHDVLVAHGLRRLFGPNAFPWFCDRRGLQHRSFQNSGFAVVDMLPA